MAYATTSYPVSQILYITVGVGLEVVVTDRFKGEEGSKNCQIEPYIMVERSVKYF